MFIPVDERHAQNTMYLFQRTPASKIAVKLLTWDIRHLTGQLSFKSDVNQNVDHWKCVTVHTLRFTLRHSSLMLRSTACYVTVHTRISNQPRAWQQNHVGSIYHPSYIHNSPNYWYQCKNSLQHAAWFLNGSPGMAAIVVSNPVRRPPCCVNRNVRYGSQGTHRAVGQ